MPEGKKLVVVTASVQKNYRKSPDEDTEMQYGSLYAECGTAYLNPVEQYSLENARLEGFFDFEAASPYISLENGEIKLLFVTDDTAEDIDICIPGWSSYEQEGIPEFICRVNLQIEEGVAS